MNQTEYILRRRMHGLYLSRKREDLLGLSTELMGLHSWFARNVAFSAIIRGADIYGWKSALTKTWLYRGTLHGVNPADLPDLLALHAEEAESRVLPPERLDAIAQKVLRLMEDGVYSRAEMRKIFAFELDEPAIARVFSPWGGIFVYLARRGLVAFRDMTSRDFDLIDAAPTQTPEQALPGLLRRYFAAYGPATLGDAAMFFGLWRGQKKMLDKVCLDSYERFTHQGSTYYALPESGDINDIPALTLLSGFDPYIVSYRPAGRFALPEQYRRAVILSSGICLPAIAVNGVVAGIWNIKDGKGQTEFFGSVPQKTRARALELVEEVRVKQMGGEF